MAAEHSHESAVIPLAPSYFYPRSDFQELPIQKPRLDTNIHSKQKSSSKCFVYILLFIVLQSIVLLILGLSFLRFTSPRVKLAHISIRNLHFSNSSSPLPSLNMTMEAQFAIDNKNFGPFKFYNSSTSVLLYENLTVGFTKISNGSVDARDNKRLNVTVQVKADGFLEIKKNLSSDIGLGMIRLRSYAKFRGQVKKMSIFKAHRTARMNCSMDLNLTSRAIQGLRCI